MQLPQMKAGWDTSCNWKRHLVVTNAKGIWDGKAGIWAKAENPCQDLCLDSAEPARSRESAKLDS